MCVAHQSLLNIDTEWLTLDVNLYNPNINAFVSARLETRVALTGSLVTLTEVQSAILFNGRFAPSVLFQVVLTFIIVFQLLLMIRDARKEGFRAWFTDGWNAYVVEAVCVHHSVHLDCFIAIHSFTHFRHGFACGCFI